jgi:hypothetical protein
MRFKLLLSVRKGYLRDMSSILLKSNIVERDSTDILKIIRNKLFFLRNEYGCCFNYDATVYDLEK